MNDKRIVDFKVVESQKIGDDYALLILSPADATVELPAIAAGQFVQVKVPDSAETFLRRPISVNNYFPETGELWLLVRNAGAGTAKLCALTSGSYLNLVLPLGNGFTMPSEEKRVLLVGGGVGVAPLLYFGKLLKAAGCRFEFLLGGRTSMHLPELDYFVELGKVNVCTDNGSYGFKGVVTQHPVFEEEFDMIYCCGPVPMMKAVAAKARERGVKCQVSLENMMACGVGACLCCVEKTVKGNVCVCTDGPVFDIEQLTW